VIETWHGVKCRTRQAKYLKEERKLGHQPKGPTRCTTSNKRLHHEERKRCDGGRNGGGVEGWTSKNWIDKRRDGDQKESENERKRRIGGREGGE